MEIGRPDTTLTAPCEDRKLQFQKKEMHKTNQEKRKINKRRYGPGLRLTASSFFYMVLSMDEIKNYPGGKNGSGVYQNIINLIPPHDIYIEGFLGSGAILKNKKPALFSICLDLNQKCLDAGRNLEIAGSIFINQDAISYLKFFISVSSILKYCGMDPFIYLDPPYPLEVRRSKKKIYKYEFSTRAHIELILVARSTNIPILISSYKNKMYESYLHDWKRVDYPAVIRTGIVTESVYMNYDQPEVLHDYRYIGKDFREREKNKGIIFRNASKINRLPAALKNALLQKLGL